MAEPMFRIVASSRKPGACRSCSAPITWCVTFPNGKAMPLHGDPVALKTEHDNEFGIIGGIVGLKRVKHVREDRWYCEGSGRALERRRCGTQIACPECGRFVRVTALSKVPNHNRAEQSA